jgi:4-hydroxy-2-oxoheptanedioate aldolase
MAEHVDAIENADEILSVPGIDVVFIGPNDLHHSMGKAPSFDSQHKEYVDALQHILKTAKKNGIAAGIHVADVATAQRRMADGFQFIAVASEAGFMLSKAQEVTGALGIKSSGPVAKY